MPRQLRPWFYVLLAAVLLYVFACAVMIRDPAVLDSMLESLPNWTGAFIITILGPASILGTEGSIGVFMAVVVIVLTCLVTARIVWRRWPETEWFAAPLLVAIVTWASSGWLLGLIATI